MLDDGKQLATPASRRRLAEALARVAMNRGMQYAVTLNPPPSKNPGPMQQIPQILEEDLGPPVYRPFPSEEYPAEQLEVDPSKELNDLFQRIERGLQRRKLLPPQPLSPPRPPELEQRDRRPLPPGRMRERRLAE